LPRHAIGAPGFWGSLIPIYGSGRAAVNDYQTGHWGWGIFNTGLAISDLLLVKDIVVIGGKIITEGGAKLLGQTVAHEALGDVALKEALERSGAASSSKVVQKAEGVIVEKVGNFYVKIVDPNASAFWRWYGRQSIVDQAKALMRLRELGVRFYFENGGIITEDVGRFTGGAISPEFWKVWARGSWRLGTILNDIRPRNIGAAGQLFDPVVEQHVGLGVNIIVRSVFPIPIKLYQPRGDGR
jgi:hypothetical protein